MSEPARRITAGGERWQSRRTVSGGDGRELQVHSHAHISEGPQREGWYVGKLLRLCGGERSWHLLLWHMVVPSPSLRQGAQAWLRAGCNVCGESFLLLNKLCQACDSGMAPRSPHRAAATVNEAGNMFSISFPGAIPFGKGESLGVWTHHKKTFSW